VFVFDDQDSHRQMLRREDACVHYFFVIQMAGDWRTGFLE